MTHQDTDIVAIKAALQEWNDALAAGDIERLCATCHPDVIVCNERQPTSVGVQALRAKYEPRMQAMTFSSEVTIHHIQVLGDYAIVVCDFFVQTQIKATQEQGSAKGRLVIGYHRSTDGRWLMALDVDNNDDKE